jgi:hypothetical protein
MDWSALVGGLIGAGIPAILAGLGLQRTRQASDAEAFGPAVLLLDRLNPDRVAFNINPDVTAEGGKWAELQKQLDVARERLLIVSAGNPRRRVRELAQDAEVKVTNAFQASSWAVHDLQANRNNPEWMDHARKTHAAADAAMRTLIDANFGWHVFRRRQAKRGCHRPRTRGRPLASQTTASAVDGVRGRSSGQGLRIRLEAGPRWRAG